MLKIPGTLQAMLPLLCFEMWSSNSSSSLGCPPFPSPWNCTHFLPFLMKPTYFCSPCSAGRGCVSAGLWGSWLCWWGAVEVHRACPAAQAAQHCCSSWCCGLRHREGNHEQTYYRFTHHCLRLFAPQKANLFSSWTSLHRLKSTLEHAHILPAVIAKI